MRKCVYLFPSSLPTSSKLLSTSRTIYSIQTGLKNLHNQISQIALSG